MKNIYKYLIGAAIVLIIVIVAVISRPKKVGTMNSPLAGGISEAKAQSFIADKYPEMKADDKLFGRPEAPLKIFVYEDYTNIYSAQLADTLDRIRAESGDKIAVIIRPYFKNSVLAGQAQAAVDCAAEQGKLVEMRALLFAQVKVNQLSVVNFSAYASQIGLNADNFAACLTKSQKSVKIEQLVREAESYTVQGTPTIFLGRDIIIGARPYDDYTDSNGDKIEGLKTTIEKMIK